MATKTRNPSMVVDPAKFTMLLLQWDAIFGVIGAKAAAGFRKLGDWLADDCDTGDENEDGEPIIGLHESSLQRRALKSLVSSWAGRIRGEQKRFAHAMVKNLGGILDPQAPYQERQDDGSFLEQDHTVAEELARRFWARQKSVVHASIKACGKALVADTRSVEEGEEARPPIEVDLSSLTGIDDDHNTRIDNIYALFVTAAGNAPVHGKTDTKSDYSKGM